MGNEVCRDALAVAMVAVACRVDWLSEPVCEGTVWRGEPGRYAFYLCIRTAAGRRLAWTVFSCLALARASSVRRRAMEGCSSFGVRETRPRKGSRLGKETRFACAVLRYEAQDEEAALTTQVFWDLVESRLMRAQANRGRAAVGWLARPVQGRQYVCDGVERWREFKVLVCFPRPIRVAHRSARLTLWAGRWKTFISTVPKGRCKVRRFLELIAEQWDVQSPKSMCFGVGFPGMGLVWKQRSDGSAGEGSVLLCLRGESVGTCGDAVPSE